MRATVLVALLFLAPLGSGCSLIADLDDFTFTGPDGDGDGDADGDGDSDGDSDCDDGQESCNGECVDLQTDENNCGECERICPHGENGEVLCQAGECELDCNDGWADCDDDGESCETNVHERDNCGDCGAACEEGQLCGENDAGEWGCVDACADGEQSCGGSCVDVTSDPEHCGGCDARCADLMGEAGHVVSWLCQDSRCVPERCDEGWGNCDGGPDNGCEADLERDAMHCGSCDVVCEAGAQATSVCRNFTCEYECDPRFADCDDDPRDCEADLTTPATCGSCSRSCDDPALPYCVEVEPDSFECSNNCPDGHILCAGGACVDPMNDPSNCGECGNVCPDVPGATRICIGGECDYVCVSPFEECDSDPENGCEARLGSDEHCTGCGDDCRTPDHGMGACESAGGSHCVIVSCDGAWADCNGFFADGCEERREMYFDDSDGDGWGDPALGELLCAAEVPDGWVANAEDCGPSDSNVYPGADERCNGIDDNCDGSADEGFGLDDACWCEAASEPGTTICVDDWSTTCLYPDEVCNGADDDCDGTRDNGPGFDCILGSIEPCVITSPDGSCATEGTRTCDDSCHLGECVAPPELCDRADDDCDGYVDNDTLAAYDARESYTASATQLHAAYDELNDAWGVVWISDETNNVAFAGLDGDGRGLSATELSGTAGANSMDICFDGFAFLVVVAQTDQVSVWRIGADSRVYASARIDQGSSPDYYFVEPRCAYLSAEDVTGVFWLTKAVAGLTNDEIYYGPIELRDPDFIDPMMLPVSVANTRNLYEYLDAVATNREFAIAVSHVADGWVTGSCPAEVLVMLMRSDGTVLENDSWSRDCEYRENGVRMAHDIVSDRVGIVYQRPRAGPFGSSSWVLLGTDPDGPGAGDVTIDLRTGFGFDIAAGGDRSFALLQQGGGGVAPVFSRRDALSLGVIPSNISLDDGIDQVLAGAQTEPGRRYMAFSALPDAAGVTTLNTQEINCAP